MERQHTLQKVEKKETQLSQREQAALAQYEAIPASNRPLSPAVLGQFYQLFLNGRNCEEIAEANKGFPLGAIVKARLEYDWDDKLAAHRASLHHSVGMRVRQTQMESINFLADLISATHKLQGQKIQRFLQTGDPAELGDIEIKSIGTYKTVLEMLMKITGQDNSKGQPAGPTVLVNNPEQVVMVNPQAPAPEQAAEILRLLEERNENEKKMRVIE